MRRLKRRSPLEIKLDSKKKNICHIGNVGEDQAYRSKILAKMCPHISFYGIDLKNIKNRAITHYSVEGDHPISVVREARLDIGKPENLFQIQKEFIVGLKLFPNNFFDIITSDFAVGFMTKYQQTTLEKKQKKRTK